MIPAAKMAKSALRQEMKQKLAKMTKEERKRQSYIVTQKVLKSDEYKKSQRICLYLSMPEEVCTMDILKDAFSSGKTCFVPRYTKTEMTMLSLRSYEDYDSLPLTKWNIKQPEDVVEREEALSSGGLDLILVPGLAFSVSGHRLGRGKGYYDAYLNKCAETTKPPFSMGLAFNEQVVDIIPTHSHDQPIAKIFYQFSKD